MVPRIAAQARCRYSAPCRATQAGFTLVEMSIVLLIFGLLIGGILKGQEVIQSARQKNVVSQVDGLRAGVNTFVDRFQVLPGDYSGAASLSAALEPGNENGIVGDATTDFSQMAGYTAAWGENRGFWTHMAAGSMFGLVPLEGGNDSFGGTSALPAAVFPGSGFTLLYGNFNRDPAYESRQHWFRIQGGAGEAGAATSVVQPNVAWQLDSKFDDGRANSGMLRALDGADPAATGCASADGVYATSNPDKTCSLYFSMLGEGAGYDPAAAKPSPAQSPGVSAGGPAPPPEYSLTDLSQTLQTTYTWKPSGDFMMQTARVVTVSLGPPPAGAKRAPTIEMLVDAEQVKARPANNWAQQALSPDGPTTWEWILTPSADGAHDVLVTFRRGSDKIGTKIESITVGATLPQVVERQVKEWTPPVAATKELAEAATSLVEEITALIAAIIALTASFVAEHKNRFFSRYAKKAWKWVTGWV